TSLPWPQLLLASAGLLWGWRARLRHQDVSAKGAASPSGGAWRASLAAGALVLAVMGLMHAGSQPLWSASTLGGLVQYPWRLLGVATLWLAWLSGAFLHVVGGGRRQTALALVAVAICFVYTYNWSYGYPTRDYPATATSLDLNRFETANSTWVGATVS